MVKRESLQTLRLLATGTLFAAGFLTSPTMVGAHGGDTTEIHACVNKASGVVHIVGAQGSCSSNQDPLDWNIQGPQGPEGPRGPAGAQGPPGDPAVLPFSVKFVQLVADDAGRSVGWDPGDKPAGATVCSGPPLGPPGECHTLTSAIPSPTLYGIADTEVTANSTVVVTVSDVGPDAARCVVTSLMPDTGFAVRCARVREEPPFSIPPPLEPLLELHGPWGGAVLNYAIITPNP